MKSMKKWQTCLPVLCAFMISGCAATAPVNIDIAAAPETDDKSSGYIEEKLGEVGYYYLVMNYKFDDDSGLAHRLRRLGTRITKYADRENIKYKYLIIDSKYHNAFSLADGYIIFTNAMIDALETDERIQAVLAHEIAHINHKHALTEYERVISKSAWKNILGSRAIAITREIGTRKAYELQADQTALRYLYRAGIDPENFISVLQMVDKLEEEDKKAFEEESKAMTKKEKKLMELLVMAYPHFENRIVNARNFIQTVKKQEQVMYRPEDFTF